MSRNPGTLNAFIMLKERFYKHHCDACPLTTLSQWEVNECFWHWKTSLERQSANPVQHRKWTGGSRLLKMPFILKSRTKSWHLPSQKASTAPLRRKLKPLSLWRKHIWLGGPLRFTLSRGEQWIERCDLELSLVAASLFKEYGCLREGDESVLVSGIGWMKRASYTTFFEFDCVWKIQILLLTIELKLIIDTPLSGQEDIAIMPSVPYDLTTYKILLIVVEIF